MVAVPREQKRMYEEIADSLLAFVPIRYNCILHSYGTVKRKMPQSNKNN